jgi:hypothetical protein
LPGHLLALDLLLTIALVVLFFKVRVRGAMVPLVAVYFHLSVQTHLVTAPSTLLQWGTLSVALGFALLAGSLGASYGVRSRLGTGE